MATYEQITSDLKDKNYKPVYFLTGEEPYFIDKITDYIAENVLTEEEKVFNQTILYGKDTDIQSVINTAKRYPMVSDQQVVIVKEAQNMVSIDDLVYYLEKPLISTILVLNYKYKKLDKRKNIYKSLQKHAVVYESKKLYDDKVSDWIRNYLSSRKLSAEPGVGLLLTEYLGNDLGKIVNELEKLFITMPPGKNQITLEQIERYIGISKEYNNFELHKALTNKDILKTNRIINYFGKNQKDNPVTLTISSLYYFFSRVLTYHFIKDRSRNNVATALGINPYFVNEYIKAASNYNPAKIVQIISTLREFDLKSKGIGNSSADPGGLLKEMIYKILH